MHICRNGCLNQIFLILFDFPFPSGLGAYAPDYLKINNNQLIVLKKTFVFNIKDLIIGNDTESEFDEFNTFEFKLGNLVNHYYVIDKRILNIDYDVYLSEDLDIRQEHFISHNNISIFKKFAKILKQLFNLNRVKDRLVYSQD